MKYNFDETVKRKNTNSIKYDFAKEFRKPEGVLPMWVADMDFRTPPEVIEALVNTAKHGIFGYTEVKEDYYNSVKDWFSKRFGFKIENDWLVKTPGVVFSVATAVRALTNPGDRVIIQPPVYYPFREVIISNKRKVIRNPLVYKNGKYFIDYKDFEEKIITNKVKMFILCSPHNPVGRVWTKSELTRIGEICLKHKVIVVSDEIHCDFIYKGFKHTVFPSINKNFLNHTVLCTAPSKSFNLAGLQVSNIFIANKTMREKYKAQMKKQGNNQINTMGLAACTAAYSKGARWMDELNEYLQNNLNFVREFINKNLPGVKLVETEGTYLIWLDFTSFKLSEKNLDDLILNKAKIWVDNGNMFGREGNGFIRINIACPLATVKTAMGRIKRALDKNIY